MLHLVRNLFHEHVRVVEEVEPRVAILVQAIGRPRGRGAEEAVHLLHTAGRACCDVRGAPVRCFFNTFKIILVLVFFL